MQKSAPQPAIAWLSLPAAIPDYLRTQAQSIDCARQAAEIVNRTAIDVWNRQVHIAAREMDLAGRCLTAIAPRNAALRATSIEISGDDLDMVINDMVAIGQLVAACYADLVDVYVRGLRESAILATVRTP